MAVIFNDGFETGYCWCDSIHTKTSNVLFTQLMMEANEKGTSIYPFLPIRIYFDGRKNELPRKCFLATPKNFKVVIVGINWLWNNLKDEGIAELAMLRLRHKFFVGKVYTNIYFG